jgi:hypothetical protein
MARLSLEPCQLAKAGCEGLRAAEQCGGFSIEGNTRCGSWERNLAGKFLFLETVLWTNLGISVAEQEFDLKVFMGLPISLRDMGKWR